MLSERSYCGHWDDRSKLSLVIWCPDCGVAGGISKMELMEAILDYGNALYAADKRDKALETIKFMLCVGEEG